MRQTSQLLKPVSMLSVKQVHEFQWEVLQRFERLDGTFVTVSSYGWNRAIALKRFDDELWQAERERPFDLLEDVGNWLWDVAGIVDWILKPIP